MRAFLVTILMVLVGCAGSMRPAVIPKLSELPTEPERRNAVLDSAHTQPGPEQKPSSKKAQKAESYAATAAAMIGLMLSDHENVTLGGAAAIDENLLFEDARPPRKPDGDKKKREEAPPEPPRDEPLVPWVRLK